MFAWTCFVWHCVCFAIWCWIEPTDYPPTAHWTSTGLPSRTSYHPALCFSSSVIFLSVDACVGLNWLLVSFLSHVKKNIIHSFIHSIALCIVTFISFLSYLILGMDGWRFSSGYLIRISRSKIGRISVHPGDGVSETYGLRIEFANSGFKTRKNSVSAQLYSNRKQVLSIAH